MFYICFFERLRSTKSLAAMTLNCTPVIYEKATVCLWEIDGFHPSDDIYTCTNRAIKPEIKKKSLMYATLHRNNV